MNKLYLLQSKESVGYDESAGFVVRAESPKKARELAGDNAADEGASRWTDTKRSSCKTLFSNGRKAVILEDFRAG